MKIAQVAPLAESVPPSLYGGTERVVSWLTDELVVGGHDVTLFATGDSRTAGNLVPVWPRALRHGKAMSDPFAAYAALLETVRRRAGEFDVIHCHSDWVHLPLLACCQTPALTTLHGRLDLPAVREVAGTFPGAAFVSISDDQRLPLPHLNWAATVYHGMPPETLSFSPDSDQYLVFLGRISPDKGPDVAIRWAKAAGRQLQIAAKLPRAQSNWFRQHVAPHVDNDIIRFVGEVDQNGKQELLGRAAALLFPIDWPEPFGLVMIEALACGTPVIARPRGSVPEIIEHGVSGFLVEDDAEAAEAIKLLPHLERRAVRDAFDRRFTAARMASSYLALYERLVRAAAPNASVMMAAE